MTDFMEARDLIERHRNILPGEQVTLAGRRFEVSSQVLSPTLTTTSKFVGDLLVAHCTTGRVLEVGVGTGYLLARIGDHGGNVELYGCDREVAAVALARRNLSRLTVPVELWVGDLFEGLGKSSKFDHVIFNPPLLHGTDANSSLERAIFDPNGSTISRFLSQVPDRLSKYGSAIVLYTDRKYSNYTGEEFFLDRCSSSGLSAASLGKLERGFETYTLWQLRPEGIS